MKANKALTLAAAISLSAAGCATGGGGGGSSNSQVADVFCLIFAGPLCPVLYQQGVKAEASQPVSGFARWEDHVGARTAASGLRTNAQGTSADNVVVSFDANRRFESLQSGDVAFARSADTYGALQGQRGIETGVQRNGAFGLAANPYDLGWSYQSFGVWNDVASPAGPGATSFGNATPAAALPNAGSARFTGTLAGTYVSAAGAAAPATAGLAVDADFGARSLALRSSGTMVFTPDGRSLASPHLDLSGRLNYAAGSSTFTGTLTNAGGTMNGTSTGKFYGPAAQEIGGVFNVKAPGTSEAFVGAYGGKR